MYTQKVFEHHESESTLHILISKLLYMGLSTQLSASSLLYALLIQLIMVQMIQDEGVYSRFSLLHSKLSNLHPNLPTTLIMHKCLHLLQMRAIAQDLFTISKCASS
jgi:hypothetical protein